MNRRQALLSVAAIATAVWGTNVSAQEFPSRTITIVHGSSAGAPQDVMLRELAKHMEEISDVSVVVEPRPGGSGQVAIATVKGQPADGHTIFSDATGITSVLQMDGSTFALDDLRPVYRIQLDPFALYVQDGGEYDDLAGLVDAMKAEPGEVRIGGYGTGTPHQFTTISLADAAQTDFTWVPFSSGTDAITAVMAGDIDGAMSNISVYGRFKGRAKVVAVTSEERVEAFPDVPTFAELGYDIQRYHWRGMLVSSDTPDDVVEDLNQFVAKAAATEGFQEFLAQTSTLDGKMSVQEFEAMLSEQAESDKKLLKSLGMISE